MVLLRKTEKKSSFIWENFYDEEERINEYDLTLFIKEGELFRKFEETHYQRCYSLDEVKEAAKEAGMDFVAAYDAFTRESVKDDSERNLSCFPRAWEIRRTINEQSACVSRQ